MSSSSPPSPPPPPSSSSSSSATPPVFGARDFSSEEKTNIRNLLQQRLGKEHLATRQGAGGAQLTYIEGWQTIQIANSIFGFNGWSSSVVELSPDFVEETQGKFRVGVTAVVKVSLKDGTSHEDVGYGLAENPRKGIAIENAKKEAVTDARKRALRLFGNALGNCIYDKGHLKRLKTAQPEAQGYLPADTTMELMNRATTGEVENGGTVSHSANGGGYTAKSTTGGVNTKLPLQNNNNYNQNNNKPPYIPIKTSAPTSSSVPVSIPRTVQIQPQQATTYQAPTPQQQHQQHQIPLGEEFGWSAESDDMAALMAAAAAADDPYLQQQQPPVLAQGNGYGLKRSSPSS